MLKVDHPFLENTSGEFFWCLHCEYVFPAAAWVENDWNCPRPGCDGDAFDAVPWSVDRWPEGEVKPEDVTMDGKFHSLYP